MEGGIHGGREGEKQGEKGDMKERINNQSDLTKRQKDDFQKQTSNVQVFTAMVIHLRPLFSLNHIKRQ